MKAKIKRIRRRFRVWRRKARAELEKRIARRKRRRDDRIEQVRDHGREFRMFDSIDLTQIPKQAEAVACYVNGYWPTFRDLEKFWPHAKRLSIAVTSSADAECLDVEPGDATPADAPGWVRRQQRRGLRQPVIYCSLSMVPAVLQALDNAGIKRSEIRLWTAHYTHEPHRCGPGCGMAMPTKADATQFTDHSGGRSLDESLCAPGFL